MSVISFTNLRHTITSGYYIDLVFTDFSDIGAISLKFNHPAFLKVTKIVGYTVNIKNRATWNDRIEDGKGVCTIGWFMDVQADPKVNLTKIAKSGKLFRVYFSIVSTPFTWKQDECEINSSDSKVIPITYNI
jgi:hypothetical protein